jgi:phosphatidylglycerol lysyltransferase
MPFPAFLALFCAAQAAGLVSHVPGGLGVFDAIMLAGIMARSGVTAVAVLASLTAFRAVYYVAPLVIGGALLIWSEGSAMIARWGGRVRSLASPHAPAILAAAIFAAGAMLLFSSATPAVTLRVRILEQVSFGPVTESAYFLSSLVGLGMLLIARGLQRRLDGAYMIALLLIALGVIFSLLKGLDYEEAFVLSALLAAFLPAHRQFSRQASLLGEPFTMSWVLGIVVVLSAAIWLAIFSSTHVLFSSTAWWHFSFTGGTPVALGATVAAVCAAAMIGGAWLLRMVPPPLMMPIGVDQDKLREAVAKAAHTPANLALVGDKGVMFSDDRKSFLMYGISGKNWVAMGDPVGVAQARADLARRFRDLARENGGRAVFYLVAPENLATYIDLGFSVKKIGETALVCLATFNLEGGSRKSLRRARSNVIAAGCEFSVVPASEVPALLPVLREVSNSWLAGKRAREKRFSLGYFDEKYLSQCPAALVRQRGRIIAFANIWESAEAGELSVDLMRYADGAPVGIMDFLLSEVMLWGKSRGYQAFDLGMAPLAGLDNGPGAPFWHRLVAVIVRRGRRFYNFEGVRKYKEKFNPTWEGRYAVLSAGVHPTVALADVARLVGGVERRRSNHGRVPDRRVAL